MDQYFETYRNYVSVCVKLSFFNSCKRDKVVPKGLVMVKNLACNVNDEDFIRQYRDNLSEASSRSFDLIIENFSNLFHKVYINYLKHILEEER